MKNQVIRNDLLSKAEYSKKFFLSRPTVDRRIETGELPVETISGKDYIKINLVRADVDIFI